MEQIVHASVSRAALSAFAGKAQEIGLQLHAIEIYENDTCLLRWAVAPYSCGDKREMYSLSKSFTATAVGVAYGMGKLSPEDPVLAYFPEYAPLCARDGRWSRLRVGHVLSMNTGHAACVMPQVVCAEDGMRAFFEQPLSHEPGSFFAYNTAASCLAAELVRRATGRTVPELLAREIFAPLGIESFRWDRCADGRCQGGTGLHVSCDDVAKLGLLYLHEGVWQGRQLLPREWVQTASALHSVNEGNGAPDWCAGYGYQFWRNSRGGYRGDGACGQLCVILPESRRVVSVASESADMAAELDAVWELLAHLHDAPAGDAGGGLPDAWLPHGALDGKSGDTGWLDFSANPAGWTGLRVQKDGACARVQFADDFGVQCVTAPSGRWQENVLFCRNFRPAVIRQTPRTERMPLRFAAASHCEDGALAIECRILNAPHAFTMRITPGPDGVQLEFAAPLNLFDVDGPLRAVRPR